jgi:uncharacterized protein DUF5818
MRRTLSVLAALLAAGALVAPVVAAPEPETFVGYISDDMCGLDHGEMGLAAGEEQCTLDCVEDLDAAFVLADREHGKVYGLSDQVRPKAFAGRKVRVTGRLDGDTILVARIQAVR